MGECEMATAKSRAISAILIISMVIGMVGIFNTDTTYAAKKKTHLKKTKVTLVVGKQYQQKLIAKNGKTIKATKVKWKTQKKSVAKINKRGRITAVKPGTAKMIAKYRGKTYKFTVKVRKPIMAPQSENEYELSEYEQLLKVNPYNVSGQTFPETAEYNNKTVYPKKDAKNLAESFLNDYVFVRNSWDPEFDEDGRINSYLERKDEELLTYQMLIDESNVSDINLYTNDMSKALKIGKGLKENFTYKYPNTNYSNYHMLYSKEGQCVHWAYLYKELLGAVGIPCVYAKSIKQNHAVNIVYLDKKWYFVDPQTVYGYYSFHPATKEWDFQGYTDWIFAEW